MLFRSVEAGDTLIFMVYGTDPDPNTPDNQITLTATSGLFNYSGNPSPPEHPASFNQPVTGISVVNSQFSWQTACSDVQLQPHTALFRVEDSGTPVQLVDYQTVNITVVGPSPKNPAAVPVGTSIHLSWDVSACPQAIGYKIYRRNGYYGFFPDHCETGVPAYTG